jgi:hypothetical protein
MVISLQYVLYQALDKLGYHWCESSPTPTREGNWQISIDVRSPNLRTHDHSSPSMAELLIVNVKQS